MAKVSVIVPVYNVEKYLKQCLDSIVDQTLEDLEIVLFGSILKKPVRLISINIGEM